MKTQRFVGLLTVCGMLLSFSGSALSGGTQFGYWNEFNINSINGTYGGIQTCEEWFTPSGGSAQKYDISTVFHSSQNGGAFTGTFTATFGDTFAASGFVCSGIFSGTSIVHADGTGTSQDTIHYTSGPCTDASETASFVIANGGNLINGVTTSVTIPASVGTVNSLVCSTTQTRQ